MLEPLEAIRNAIMRFNHFRSPEAVAEFIAFDSNELHVRFNGSFCQTCGILDYFEDLIFELDSTSPIALSILDFVQEDEDTFRVRYSVTYRKPSCAR